MRKKRETLQKRAPAPLDIKLAVTADVPDAAELGVSTPTTKSASETKTRRHLDQDPEPKPLFKDPPAHCVELPAEPAPRRPLVAAAATALRQPDELDVADGEVQSTGLKTSCGRPTDQPAATERQRSQSLQRFPSCLVPGTEWSDVRYNAPVRAATWSVEAPKDLDSNPAPMYATSGFGSGWWSGNAPTPGSSSDSQSLSTASPSWGADSAAAGTAFSSPYLTSPLSSETSLLSGNSPDAKLQPISSLARRRSASQLPLEGTLSPKQSASNMKRLMARHSVLESRRQILLQLHEIEQQQQHILEELADMPEENESLVEAGKLDENPVLA